MIARLVYRAGETLGTPADLLADAASLDAFYEVPSADWLRLNLVASIDGSIIGSDGTSASLTRGSDRKVLGAIRRASDIVLVGAATVRAESYRLPRAVPVAIVTGSGELGGHSFPGDTPPGRVLVLTTSNAAERARATLAMKNAEFVVLKGSAAEIDPTSMVDALRSRGFRSIVCEGGPHLAGQLVAAGVVDEFCLSTSPVIGGPQRGPLAAPSIPALQRGASLIQLMIDEAGVSYARWAVDRSARESSTIH